MSMMVCWECQAAVSDAASACPKCGAPIGGAMTLEKPVREGATGLGLKIAVGVAVGVGALILIGGMTDPQSEERARARDAISLCWEEQSRKSLDPASARFVAGACELLEERYAAKYRRKP